jgi:hypothetical protein
MAAITLGVYSQWRSKMFCVWRLSGGEILDLLQKEKGAAVSQQPLLN